MKITFVITECRDKISETCTKTFQRKVQRGRPQVNCDNCKLAKLTVVSSSASTDRNRTCDCGKTFEVSEGRGRKHTRCEQCRKPAAVINEGEFRTKRCGCGKDFKVKAGKGRKASKCEECREAGIVYRSNDDGEIEAIQKATIAEEQREIREQRGREIASRLTMLMAPLLAKTDRKVIRH